MTGNPEATRPNATGDIASMVDDGVPLSSAVPVICADCRQPIAPTERRLILGNNSYHADRCGPQDDGVAMKKETEMTADDFKRLAKKLSTALVDLTPGGSEYFTLVGDDYYADIDACVRVIRENAARTVRFARERNVQRQRAEAAEAAVAEARKALKAVEEWWLNEEMNNHIGAPHAIFAARAWLTAHPEPTRPTT